MGETLEVIAAIDVGNTSTSFALFSANRVLVYHYLNNYEIPKIAYFINKSGVSTTNIHFIISSVVPKISLKLTNLIKKKMAPASLSFIGKQAKISIPMKYKRRQLGADRAANIYGAIRKGRLPALIIDFGTAITFDLVSKKGVLEGGLIVPGIEISTQALYEKTALLPRISLSTRTKSFLGHDTTQAMNYGVLNGFGALADGMIGRFRKKYGRKLCLVVTGGSVLKLLDYTNEIKKSDVDLLHTLKALAWLKMDELKRNHRQKGRGKVNAC